MKKTIEIKSTVKQNKMSTSQNRWIHSNNEFISRGDKGHVTFPDPKDINKLITKTLHVDKVLGKNSDLTKIVCHEIVITDEGKKHIGHLLEPSRFKKIQDDERRVRSNRVIKHTDADREIEKAMFERRSIGLREGLVYQDIMDNLKVVDGPTLPEPQVSYKEISKDA